MHETTIALNGIMVIVAIVGLFVAIVGFGIMYLTAHVCDALTRIAKALEAKVPK